MLMRIIWTRRSRPLKNAQQRTPGGGFDRALLGIEGRGGNVFSIFQRNGEGEDDMPVWKRLWRLRKGGKQLSFNFSNRNRRPPTDPVNAMLSLAYSMLAKDCTLAALAVGFDPYVGFYQPALRTSGAALD